MKRKFLKSIEKKNTGDQMQVTDYNESGYEKDFSKRFIIILVHQSVNECKNVLSKCRGIMLNPGNPRIRITEDAPYHARISLPYEMARSTTEFGVFIYNLSQSERHGYVNPPVN
jgi:hypothetical protein